MTDVRTELATYTFAWVTFCILTSKLMKWIVWFTNRTNRIVCHKRAKYKELHKIPVQPHRWQTRKVFWGRFHHDWHPLRSALCILAHWKSQVLIINDSASWQSKYLRSPAESYALIAKYYFQLISKINVQSAAAIVGIIFQIASKEKSQETRNIQHLYLPDTRVHFMTINFAFSSVFYHNGCEALSRVSLIKSICLQRREFDLIKIIRNILDKYHPRSSFDLQWN